MSEIDSYYKGIISRFPAFLLGMYMAKCYHFNSFFVAVTGVFLLGLLMISLTGYFKGRPNEYVYVLLAPTLIIFALFFCKIAMYMKLNTSLLYNYICFMGNLSLQLYLCHEYVYSFVKNHYFFHPYGLLCLAILLSIFIAFVLRYISDKTTKNLLSII